MQSDEPGNIRAERFILENAVLAAPSHVPSISLYLASEANDLWRRTEEELAEIGLPPPFWAFAWARRAVTGAPRSRPAGNWWPERRCSTLQRLGPRRHSGAKAGAARAMASDTDPFAAAAARPNFSVNAAAVEFSRENLIGRDEGWDTVLAGDVF